MDSSLSKLWSDVLTDQFKNAVISSSTDKSKMLKVRIKPVVIKGVSLFQIEEFIGTQVFQKNLSASEVLDALPSYFDSLFRQAEIVAGNMRYHVLISKKGTTTIKKAVVKPAVSEVAGTSEVTSGVASVPLMFPAGNNRQKNHILKEGIPVPFLVELGVMTKEGKVISSKYDKFKQINRFLEFVADILPALPKGRELTILDFGCGKSYLTFAIYHYLKIMNNCPVRIIGVDLKTDVIYECNRLKEILGYDGLTFIAGDIADYEGLSQIDMMVTLHACDTATDIALSKAVRWGASVILSVPCCQHEINKQIENDILSPILKYGIVKERISALITDAIRAELLSSVGYQTQLLEFIDMEHTPKNILIRAVKTGKKTDTAKLEQCMKELHIRPSLYEFIKETAQE